MKTYQVLVLAGLIAVVGEELENDNRKHDLYHAEQRSYEGAERPTHEIRWDSGSSCGITGTAAITLPRLRVQGFGTFTPFDPSDPGPQQP